MKNKINKKLAYETLNKYLNINKNQLNELKDNQLEILLNFISNELIIKNK